MDTLSTAKKISIFITIVIIGSVIGALGSATFPILKGIVPFWPAAAIQALSGILFGMTGVLAATIFPIISNSMSSNPPELVILLIPPNLIQAFFPFLVKKITKFLPYKLNKKTVILFVVFCVIVPNVLGALWVCNIKFFLVNGSPGITKLTIFFSWLKSNAIGGIIFGLLLLKTLAPALKNCGLYDNSDEEKNQI